jgi:hypothetical protein
MPFKVKKKKKPKILHEDRKKLISYYILCINALKWILQKHVMGMWMGDLGFDFSICNVNPLPSLTFQIAQDLNVPCRPKRSKAFLL